MENKENLHVEKTVPRVLQHLGFWVFIYALMLFYIPSNLNNTSSIKIELLLFFATRDILIVSICYYVFEHFVYKNIFLGKIFQAFVVFCILYLLLFFTKIATVEYSLVYPRIFKGLEKWFNAFLKGKTYWDRFLNPNFHWTLVYWYGLYFSIAVICKVTRDFEKYKSLKLKLETDNLNYELQRFNSQLNPNYVLKTLHSMQENLKSSEPRASEITKKLMNLMNYSLNDSKNDLVPLEKEIQFIEEYISLEKIRHSKKVQIDFLVSGDVIGLEIPPLLLITFVENAFKHGINKTILASWVKVDLKIEDKKLTFNVKNSIPKVELNAPKGGIGLANAKKRLDLLFDNNYKLSINENTVTFEIELILNLSKQTESV